MSEAELEEQIRAYCEDLGILRFHVRDSRGMARGFPDDILIGRHRLLWRECKSETGSLSPAQRDVGERLRRAGQSFAVWRPRDLASGAILRELREISAAQGELFDARRTS
jgi:hypothetical protein